MPRIKIGAVNSSDRNAEIVFGALAPRLAEQLKVQEIVCEGDLKEHQRCVDEIAHLYLKGLLAKDEVERARRRLVKAMALRRQDSGT